MGARSREKCTGDLAGLTSVHELDEPRQTEVNKNHLFQLPFEDKTLVDVLKGIRLTWRGTARLTRRAGSYQVPIYHILTDQFRCEDVQMRLD